MRWQATIPRAEPARSCGQRRPGPRPRHHHGLRRHTVDRDSEIVDRDTAAADRDEQLSGATAERTEAAAPGATVREVERESDIPGVAYEVELVKPDGSTVELHLDASYQPVGSDQAADRDTQRDSDHDTD